MMDENEESVDEAREVERLVRFLVRDGRRFGIALALYRDPRVAHELREVIEAKVGERGLRMSTVEFGVDDGETDLVGRMAVVSEGMDGLFVVGLDQLLVDATGRSRRTSAVANLNQRRDDLSRVIDARVVLWVSKSAVSALQEEAWDLHEVMLTVAEIDRVVSSPLRESREVEALPAWISFAPEGAEADTLRRAEALDRAARAAGDLRTRADALASAALAYITAVHLDIGAERLEEAATSYESVGELPAASIQRRRLAEVRRLRGDFAAAETQLTLAIDLAESGKDDRQAASARSGLADILFHRGDPDAALDILREQVLPIYEHLGDVRDRAVTMGKIADILQARGDFDRALQIREQDELPIYERAGDVYSAAVTMGKIADILQTRGDLDRALQIRRHAQLPIFERLGTDRAKAITMGRIADILQRQGDLDGALQIRQHDQLPIFERLGDVRSKAITMGRIADILQTRGDLDQALHIRQHDEFPVYESTGDVYSKAVVATKIADILSTRGELDQALAILRKETLPAFERLGDIRSTAIANGKIADILQRQGKLDQALLIRKHDELPVFERIGDIRERAVTMGKIADILQDRGDLDQALHIRQHDQLPAFERVGDVQSRAITMGKIADILRAKGELDRALHILVDEELPALERIGDMRSKAVALCHIVAIRLQQDDPRSRVDAVALLSEAYRILARMGLRDAETVRSFAETHDLELDVSDPS